MFSFFGVGIEGRAQLGTKLSRTGREADPRERGRGVGEKSGRRDDVRQARAQARRQRLGRGGRER